MIPAASRTQESSSTSTEKDDSSSDENTGTPDSVYTEI